MFAQNNWNEIREFYKSLTPLILETPKNEWATDPYCWNGLIHFTPIEDWLWFDIRNYGAVMYPQYPVLNFFVDFANPKAKVAIECDGYEFHLDKEKDAERDRQLVNEGWTVYRISGADCKTDFDSETGQPGTAQIFMRDICRNHGISRAKTWNCLG